MAHHRVAGNLKTGEAAPRRLPFVRVDHGVGHIRNEICLPVCSPPHLGALLPFGEELFLRIVTVFELVVAVENEILVVKNVDDHWGIGYRCQQCPL